jgi:RNA-directed DNA polymerase
MVVGVDSSWRVHFMNAAWGISYAPTLKARTALLSKLRDIFRRFRSQPVDRLIALINPILRGWVNDFRVGPASRCFGYMKN